MIISASRRTDIPNYYSNWFYDKIKEKGIYVTNSYNKKSIFYDLSPENIDMIVFWTKNPENMIPRLNELKDYQYYFQFTITPYRTDIEPNVPSKILKILGIFKKLSEMIGKDRVVWRYDPILINDVYTINYHIQSFGLLCNELSGYTNKCVISFLDIYGKLVNKLSKLNLINILSPYNFDKLDFLLNNFSQIAKNTNIQIETCAEVIDLNKYNIKKGACIDRSLIEQLLGRSIKESKDKGQRGACCCIKSIDIGTYNTCRNGCVYCYACL